jgi:hypothetical protein
MNKKIIILLMIFLNIFIVSSQATTLNNGLIAYYNFEENSAFVKDLVNGIHNATNNGAILSANGIIGNSFFLMGANENVVIPYHQEFDFGTNSFTISGWFNPSDLSNPRIVVDSWGFGPHFGIRVGESNNRVSFLAKDGGNGVQLSHSSSTYTNGTWLLISLVIDRQTQRAKLYVNGLLEANELFIGVGSLTTNQPIFIGDSSYQYPNFRGNIDEIGIWNRALTQFEILQLYNNGTGYSIFNFPAPPQPPILSQIGPKSIQENQTLTIQLYATDINPNTTLTFLTNAQTILPSYSFLNSTSGLFTWTPTYNDQGYYNVTFYVTDGTFVTHETIQITVVDVSFATITLSNPSIMGNTITFNLNDPLNPNSQYVFSGSFGNNPGIPLGDGRIIRLNNDWLFNALLYVPQLFGFFDTTGTLNSQGNAQVTWQIPNIPGAQGTQLHFSFITINTSIQGTNSIRSVSQTINLTLQ